MSHASTIDLGDDAFNDDVTVLGNNASLTIIGNTGGNDVVTLDRSGLATPIAAGQINDGSTAGSAVLSGFTDSTINLTNLGTANVLLGGGNNQVTIDTAPNLSETQLRVQGGAGIDSFIVDSIAGRSVVSGGGGNDSATVTIAGVPTANQFSDLRLDLEELVVNNQSNTVSGIAWTLTNDELAADTLSGGNPSGNSVSVVNTSGVARTQILGGTLTDSLDVHATVGNEVIGTIDLDGTPHDSCLLYTSPSPRDQRGSRMPSSA